MVDYKKKDYYDKLIRLLLEYKCNTEFNDKEWEAKKGERDYDFYKKILLSRNGITNDEKYALIEKAEILYIIKLLSKRIAGGISLSFWKERKFG